MSPYIYVKLRVFILQILLEFLKIFLVEYLSQPQHFFFLFPIFYLLFLYIFFIVLSYSNFSGAFDSTAKIVMDSLPQPPHKNYEITPRTPLASSGGGPTIEPCPKSRTQN